MKNSKENVSFGEAVKALNKGKRVARKNWTSFVFRQVPADISAEIVPKMQSLPQSVKDEFERRGGSICYNNQLATVDIYNLISGWNASPEDILAEDWEILD